MMFSLSGCYAYEKQKYYSQEENYVNVTGTLTFINYNDEESILYLGFSDLNPDFDDNCFKIVGENLSIAQENGIDEKIKIGDQIEFVSAPEYFGDGYVMPIVEISVDGEVLLDFEKGYENWLKWIE